MGYYGPVLSPQHDGMEVPNGESKAEGQDDSQAGGWEDR